MKSKFVLGMILILLGVGFLLDQFNVISFGAIMSTYWPMIIIIIGVTNLFDRDSSKLGNTILIFVGVMFQINALNILTVSMTGLIIPIALIIIGISILFSRKKESKFQYNLSSDNKNGNLKNIDGDSDSLPPYKNVSTDNVIDAFAFMSGVETHNRSLEFRGGRATSIMGGIDIDLRGAVPFEGVSELELTSIMGGIEVLVPESWRVEVKGTPLLGEISNKSRYNPDPDAPVLRIKGFVLMGSIEIK